MNFTLQTKVIKNTVGKIYFSEGAGCSPSSFPLTFTLQFQFDNLYAWYIYRIPI